MTIKESVYERAPVTIQNEIPVFIEPDAYSENYEQIARDHMRALQQGTSNPFIQEEIWKGLEDSTLTLLRKYGSPGNKVLDIGVGLGRLLGPLTDFDRYGVDVSLAYLVEAKKQGIEVCCAKTENLPYCQELFDVVVCTDVLEHVFDLNGTIRAMLRVLKKGGLLILRVPDREDLSPYLASSYPYRYAHVRNFDESGLRLLFSHIFHCEFLESALVHCHYPAKMKLPWARWRLTSAIGFLTRWNPDWRDWTARSFYRPLEVNAVFRKR